MCLCMGERKSEKEREGEWNHEERLYVCVDVDVKCGWCIV